MNGGAPAPASELARLQQENQRLEREVASLRGQLETASAAGAGRTIFGLTDLLVATDAQGALSYLNSAAERHYGVARAEVTGRPLGSLRAAALDGELLAELAAELQRTGQPLTRRIVSAPEGGELRAWLIKATQMPGGLQLLITDRSELERMERTLARYISPSVMEAVLEAGVDPFRAQKHELTVLFADLRGFTSMSSSMEAEDVKALIDEYLTVQIDVVLGAGATLDKIVGDEVMAVFGAPLPAKDHALWAINTALKMREGHRRLMEVWQRRGVRGCPLGIGINTGEMVVGNIGSHRRMDYTVLGHHVNLGARLCSAAKGGEILLAMRTFEQVKESLTRDPGAVWRPVKFRRGEAIVAKGITGPVDTVVVAEA